MLSYVIYCKPVNIIMKNTIQTNKWKQKPLKNVIKKQNNNIQKWYINHIQWNFLNQARGTHIFELWRAAAAQLMEVFFKLDGHTKNFNYRQATTTVSICDSRSTIDVASIVLQLCWRICAPRYIIYRQIIGKIKGNCAVNKKQLAVVSRHVHGIWQLERDFITQQNELNVNVWAVPELRVLLLRVCRKHKHTMSESTNQVSCCSRIISFMEVQCHGLEGGPFANYQYKFFVDYACKYSTHTHTHTLTHKQK